MNTASINDSKATKEEILSKFIPETLSNSSDADLEEGGDVVSSSLVTTDVLSNVVTGSTEEMRLRGPVSLEPPLSRSEELRDELLRFLDHPFFQVMGIIVLVLIILSGALFFFLLLGWQTLCDTPSRTDCEPRNTCFNISIQILNGLFTYMAMESMPWRCTQFLHVAGGSCPYRLNDVGYDIFGLPSREIWYHIPKQRRIGICVCLLLNCITQFSNQATRIVYPTFVEANAFPGNFWTNVFFVSSMLFAAIGGVWMLYEEHVIHKKHPNVFAPSVIILITDYVRRRNYIIKRFLCPCCGCSAEIKGELQGNSSDNDQRRRPQIVEPPDHVSTPHHEHVLPLERTNARLWAL
ncbi:DUF2985 domain containing protein [Nitzschia inconspicua]|uniref:DUF2985 domain containing protein n=1 Tax=Nitzschia inconspicua TaxID=303405 RepID=A0A9K3Q0F9_9STRA|nr:DUF2985 domain containing protein [Nitzschia inconspicua]